MNNEDLLKLLNMLGSLGTEYKEHLTLQEKSIIFQMTIILDKISKIKDNHDLKK